jgi:hypothetical protein
VSTFVQMISEEEMATKACGRVCADMRPSTLPVIPLAPPPSLSALMRDNPDIEFQKDWLAAMDAGETIH